MSLKNRELQVYVGLDPGRTIFFLNSLVSFFNQWACLLALIFVFCVMGDWRKFWNYWKHSRYCYSSSRLAFILAQRLLNISLVHLGQEQKITQSLLSCIYLFLLSLSLPFSTHLNLCTQYFAAHTAHKMKALPFDFKNYSLEGKNNLPAHYLVKISYS